MPSRFSKKMKSASSFKPRLAQAGLVHKRRVNTSHRAPQLERFSPDELRPAEPIPRLAANGVQWLPIPGWEFPWLWAGFSTRKGGLSRAYCPESFSDVADAPGL